MPDQTLLETFVTRRLEDTPSIRAEVHQDPFRNDFIVRLSTVLTSELRVSQRDMLANREHALRFADVGIQAFRRRVTGEDGADLQAIARMRFEEQHESLMSLGRHFVEPLRVIKAAPVPDLWEHLDADEWDAA